MAKIGALGSLESFLGTFGRGIISDLQAIGGSILDALSLGREVGVNPALGAVTQEWQRIESATKLEPSFSTLRPFELVPHEWFTTSDIPWKREFAYQVHIYGKDLETGKFSAGDRWFTADRELTVDEIETEANNRMGAVGITPRFEIMKVTVIGAERSYGAEPW